MPSEHEGMYDVVVDSGFIDYFAHGSKPVGFKEPYEVFAHAVKLLNPDGIYVMFSLMSPFSINTDVLATDNAQLCVMYKNHEKRAKGTSRRQNVTSTRRADVTSALIFMSDPNEVVMAALSDNEFSTSMESGYESWHG